MGVLSNLEPKRVFFYFEEICQIPHPSYGEKMLSDYCVEFAKSHGLEHYQDELGNVILIKEASAGCEAAPPLILQGHLDMVCEKAPGREIDFEKDGLELLIDGDFICARGTTLGGDDGIAVAYALALLEDDTLAHPRLEAVFTVSEETGMEGADAIDLSPLKGNRLLNLDSEEEGYLLVSCAGGCSARSELTVKREKQRGRLCELVISGLKGGHSGTEINEGGANANVLMGRILLALSRETDYGLVSVEGGQKSNAIPREARAKLLVEAADADKLEETAKSVIRTIQSEYAAADGGISLSLAWKGEKEALCIETEDKRKVLALLNLHPNGVQAMSQNVKGLVETSLNLGIVKLQKDVLKLWHCVRSSVESSQDYLVDRLRLLTEMLGGRFAVEGRYPAWEFRKDSPFREMMIRIHEEMYGKPPIVQALHAGLECGLLAGKISDLDAVSIGPDMQGVHTTEEKLSISSVGSVWKYVRAIVEESGKRF